MPRVAAGNGPDPLPNPELAASCGTDIVLVIDGSGSIDGTEYSQMQAAFVAFVEAFLPETPTEFALVEFATTAVVRQGFTGDETTITNEINSARQQPGGVYTNWEQGLSKAHGLFPNRANPDLIVFASDGNPNRKGDPASTGGALDAAITEANSIKTDGIRIITIGIGDGLDTGNLEDISSADAVITSGFDTLADDLAQLARDLCGGTISVHKVIDDDGDPSTTDDQTASGSDVAGWTFTPSVTGGTADPTEATTDDTGAVVFDISIENGTATASIAETANTGFDLVGASCTGATDNGSYDGSDSVDGIDIGPLDIVSCTFYNTPQPTPTPTPTPSPTPTAVAEVVQLPATGGAPSDGGSGLAWLAAIAGAIAVMSVGGFWIALRASRVR